MPGIEDWRTRPHATIQHIFEEHIADTHENFVANVEDYFSKRLNEDALRTLPSINTLPLDQLRSGTLVKYRCMVQDIYDPQYFAGRYTVSRDDGSQARVECGCFRDVPTEVKPNETLNFDGPNCATAERHTFYCVPLPGESSWVKEEYDKHCRKLSTPTSISNIREKRERDSDESEMESDQKVTREDNQAPSDEAMNQEVVVNGHNHQMAGIEGGAGQTTKSSNLPSLNLPLPDEKGVPCMVRVYSKSVELKATDAIEVVGILCMDPRLASMYDVGDDDNDIADKEELQAHEPPASLVPRLHAVVIRVLEHNNPLLPIAVQSESYQKAVSDLKMDLESLRLEVLTILEHALLGDKLAAEYLLYYLISFVYARADLLPLGKFCVNISNCPPWQGYSRFLHNLFSRLVTQSVFFEMSIKKMNSTKLIPKKDYVQNRITAGMLQLAKGTTLVVDELALQQGQLNSQGVNNVKALADLIKWQKVEYDFQWHPIPVHSDVNVLVLSEGESLLPKDINLPVVPGLPESTNFNDHFNKLEARLTAENLGKVRCYLSICRLQVYQVDEGVQKLIQDDFVQTRQEDANNMSVEDFQTLLGLVRLICVSHGSNTPHFEMWNLAKSLEQSRKERITQRPVVNWTAVNPPVLI